MKTKHFIRPAAVGALAYENGIKDSKDCTVRALANAASMPYTEAHSMLAAVGRVNEQGMRMADYSKAYFKAGFRLVSFFGTTDGAILERYAMMHSTGIVYPREKGISFGRLVAERLQRGRFIVLVRGHALAVVNGKVFDTHATSNQKSVIAYFELQG